MEQSPETRVRADLLSILTAWNTTSPQVSPVSLQLSLMSFCREMGIFPMSSSSSKTRCLLSFGIETTSRYLCLEIRLINPARIFKRWDLLTSKSRSKARLIFTHILTELRSLLSMRNHRSNVGGKHLMCTSRSTILS